MAGEKSEYEKAYKLYLVNDAKYKVSVVFGNELAKLKTELEEVGRVLFSTRGLLSDFSAETDKTTDIAFKKANNAYREAMKIKRQERKKTR